MKTTIFAAVLAGITFPLFYFGLTNTGLWVSLAITAGVFVAGLAASPFRKPAEPKPAEIPSAAPEQKQKPAPDAPVDLIAEGNRRIGIILEEAKRIKSQEVKDKIAAICEISGRIFDHLREDPSDLKRAKKFVLYYLDSTTTIVKKYADLSRHTVQSADMTKTLKRAETLLDTIREAFEKQLLSFLENDVMDLDVEVKTLESNIKMEGF
ncbi:MAG: hypothetical protein A2Y33_13160 [Spirochaetes bacterium GWF1_51_8]|nr:MAG: hypothetical protein A2Y33_13160 [Spirochaetes bacterium GWF1_51_8]